jgi:ABC-type Fe3+-hydroxamate transport system substrate-binding protein
MLTGARIVFESSAQVNEAVDAQLATGESLYTLDEVQLAQLRPQVIVTQSLCHVCSVSIAQVERVVARIAASAAKKKDDNDVDSHAPPPPKIVSLNPQCLEDVLQDLVVVGAACGLKTEGERAAAALRERAARAEALAAEALNARGRRRPIVAFCEWVDPIFVGGHWTPQLIAMAGGHHALNPPKMAAAGVKGGTGAATACGASGVLEAGAACAALVKDAGCGAAAAAPADLTSPVATCGGAGAGSNAQRSAEEEIARQAAAGGADACHGGNRPLGACPSFAVHNERVAELDPDFVIIAPCGLDIPTTLRELSNSGVARSEWFRGLKAVKGGGGTGPRCVVVDGNQMFNRPGPRLVDALEFLVGLINDRPDVIPSDFPWVAFDEAILPLPQTKEEQKAAAAAAAGGGHGGGGGGG